MSELSTLSDAELSHTRLVDLLTGKALMAWASLQKYRDVPITEDEVNYLFASYVLGLTLPIYGERSPEDHLDACSRLLALKLDTAAIERALHTVPAPTQPWVETAYDRVEQFGSRDAQACLGVLHPSHKQATADMPSPQGKAEIAMEENQP
ncbi:hypothetical protein G6L33_22275 [Agrobacterium rhizogenes]|nr:hypothetical protein [Rhizobium rhizogenes]NTH66590.1 hypothetical protein [Rhizobium rhizogenes]